MGKYGTIVARGMVVNVHNFSWVDSYLDCGCTISDDTPIFNVSGWKGVRYFPMIRDKYTGMVNIMKLV